MRMSKMVPDGKGREVSIYDPPLEKLRMTPSAACSAPLLAYGRPVTTASVGVRKAARWLAFGFALVGIFSPYEAPIQTDFFGRRRYRRITELRLSPKGVGRSPSASGSLAQCDCSSR